MDAVFEEIIGQKSEGVALLEHLLPCIPYLSLESWSVLFEKKLIQLDGQIIAPDTCLKEGQVLRYTVPDYEEAKVNTSWKILWQDEKIFAVHKPANLPVSRTTRNVYNTLIQLLRRESGWPDAHLLHRLDLETSGIILIAKNKEAAREYQPKLAQLLQQKVYHAIIKGKPNWQDMDFECHLNTQENSPIRCQMHVIENEEEKKQKSQGKKAKHSHTRFKVLSSNGEFSMVQCELLTGRKHQIRTHLSALGHPIVGDKIYANQGEFYLKRLDDKLETADHNKLLSEHHLLHAFQVRLNVDQGKVIIKDELYSEAYLAFCQKHGLTLTEC